MLRFAANISMLFNEVAFPDRFQAAKQAGFEAVEFQFPYEYTIETIAGALKNTNLSNILFNLPPGNWQAGERGLAAIPGKEDDFRQSLDRALAYALALKTPQLHAMAGIPNQAMKYNLCKKTYIENLIFASKFLEEHDIRLLIEPINTHDIPGYFLHDLDEAERIIEAVSSSNLFIQMDLYHIQIMQGDLARRIRKHLPHVGHIQIAGIPDRHEPDQGEIYYPYLFKLLEDLGYTGYIGCEYWPKTSTIEGLDWRFH